MDNAVNILKKVEQDQHISSYDIAEELATTVLTHLIKGWDWKDIIHYELLPPGKAINSDLYCQQLMKLKQELEKKRLELSIERVWFFTMIMPDHTHFSHSANIERVIALLGVFALCNASILQGTIDTNKLQNILNENVKSKDFGTLYYAFKGLKQLNVKISITCEDFKNAKYDLNNIEQVFYLTNAATLSLCQNSLNPDVLQAATRVLDKKDVTLAELYYAVHTLKALGKGTIYDKEDGLKNLVELLKKDETPANYGYVFLMCEHMGCESWTAERAESLILQADESDGKALHWEGGLPVTATILGTLFRSFKTLKKPAPFTEEQKLKFGEYLLSRRSVNTAKGATLLLEAATVIADDQPTPISIKFKGKKHLTSESDTIEFSVSDLIGRPLKTLKPEEVIAQSGTRLADDVVVLSKQPLTQKPGEPTTYVLNLAKIKSQYGTYKIALSAGSKVTNVNIAVLGEIQVTNMEVGVGDIDGTTSPKTTTVIYPNKLGEKLHADHLQKVFLKFSLRDKANKPITVQQAFVRVGSSNSDEEIIFIAEPDNSKVYKVELNVGMISKHFGHVSGVYSVELYVGDAAAARPLLWSLADVDFNFAKDANAIGEYATTPSSKTPARVPLPEIKHTFREPEARPARLVSDVFACACAAPLLLLLALWAKLRVNLSNIPIALSTLIFHIALGGVLCLYAMFWVQMTMFETMRYLVPLAALIFLGGHRLLRTLANKGSRPHKE
ncbi:Dolichyl-diphosphooligosaccharide--protein glycosyltransferase subunit 2 [Eumeta japonica]|uniref:Dolichyl-diphosphooligosaccharide--protein glycosyltransferase subunit 2 n=1 Tax=Eumeta variegata TaxID=151549 RepID=A0A4C1VZY7_EUMVA|nr:Dolichyl-diphosphooligosaccharide--protein glycosyltransferase subunit 2 [Eumeta japonica]